MRQTDGDDGEREDEVRGEPVLFLAFVEHYFEGAEAESEQAEAGVVDLEAVAETLALEVRRVEDQ